MRRRRNLRRFEILIIFAALAVVSISWVRSVPRGEPAAARTFKAAAIQMYSRMGDTRANRDHMVELARKAALRGADVIVFPEAAATGYVSEDSEIWTDPVRRPGEGRPLFGYAETLKGETVRALSSVARAMAVYIVVPFIEMDRGQKKYFNALVLVGPDGAIKSHYRKISPWPRAEATWAADGDLGLAWADTEFGRLGLLICYDIHSVARKLADKQCDTLLYSVAWVDAKPEMWFEERLPLLVKHYGVNLVAANWTFHPARPPAEKGYGYSRIIGADGKILARAGANLCEEIVIAELPVGKHSKEE